MKRKILELKQERAQISRAARAELNTINDDSSEKECLKIEKSFDKKMRRMEAIELELLELGDEGDPRRPIGDNGTYPPEATTRWHDTATGKDVRVVQHGKQFSTEQPEVSLGATLRAMSCGARNDAEKRALSEGTDSAGGFTVPTPLASNFIDLLRAKSRVFGAGAQTVELPSETLSIARVVSDPVPAWRAEAGVLAESDPVLGKTTFTARSLSVLVKASRELVQDSANIEQILERIFAESFAAEVDRVALLGSGTAPEPKGISNWTGVGAVSMGTNGLAITSYAEILSAMQALEDANVETPTAGIMAPRSKYAIAGLVDTTNQPLNAPAVVAEVPFLATSKMPINETHGTATDASRIIIGGFKQVMIGFRLHLQIEMLRERYADTLEYGFLGHLRADIQVLQPGAFAQITGIIP